MESKPPLLVRCGGPPSERRNFPKSWSQKGSLQVRICSSECPALMVHAHRESTRCAGPEPWSPQILLLWLPGNRRSNVRPGSILFRSEPLLADPASSRMSSFGSWAQAVGGRTPRLVVFPVFPPTLPGMPKGQALWIWNAALGRAGEWAGSRLGHGQFWGGGNGDSPGSET